MDKVIAHETAAKLSDRIVSFLKQCFGITLITSRFVGKVFSCRASPFNPLNCTPSISIATGDEVAITTGGGMATTMVVRGRTAALPLALRTADGTDDAKRVAAENDDWVVKALVPHEHKAIAEAVAAAVVFMSRVRRRCRLR